MIDEADEGYRLRIETIAHVLMEIFGDRAIEVARTQSALAEMQGAVVWEAIVTHLTRD